ncbi:PREDICTED: pleckstrin [Hipposideros armiger]|uniref:Pleckstrin n=1 Tax=Hipposideros armiger TaxID=186990 RepID=A0A8B7QRX9_HIPAR|nr:PREDICTED: pleckstrin [Hipposideros armiger]
MEPKRIREGYLVKRGSVFNTWKPMWVVLLEDGIEFYKKKSDNSPKGMIPLKGSTLNSPCQDFGKRMFVFKITTTKQQDHFFQAAFLEERDCWVRDIKKAIKCIEGGQKFARKSTRRSIRLPETIDLGFFVVNGLLTDLFLTHLTPMCPPWINPDSGFFCEENSSDDDIILKEEFRGVIIKQGCLLKQVSGPHYSLLAFPPCQVLFISKSPNYDFMWLVVNYNIMGKKIDVLRKILTFELAGGNQLGEDPLGAIRLRGCVVTSVESNSDGKKSEEENLFEIITADEIHYFLQAATPKERTEWIKAIQVTSRTGK